MAQKGEKLSFLIQHDWKFQPHETIYQNGWNQDDIEIGQKLDKNGQKWQGSEVRDSIICDFCDFCDYCDYYDFFK